MEDKQYGRFNLKAIEMLYGRHDIADGPVSKHIHVTLQLEKENHRKEGKCIE